MENLEKMKNKFESGEYELIFKHYNCNPRYAYVDLQNFWDAFKDNNGNLEYIKLIHKKHKNILDAYLEDNSVEIEYESTCNGWITIDNDFIAFYDESEEYILVKTKPKNNFKDFGFSGDFEGEIFKEVNQNQRTGTKRFIGHFINEWGVSYPCIWEEWGKCNFCTSSKYGKYNLTPLKKNWYEVEDNFRIVVKNIKSLENYEDKDGEIYIMEKHTDNFGCSSYKTNGYHTPVQWLQCYRPATKEEVEKLIIKD